MPFIRFYILLIFINPVFSQTDKNKNIKPACDCKDAIVLDLSKSTNYDLIRSPQGFGSVQEIKATSPIDKLAFEAEHNTTWYLLNIHFDGELIFELIPADTTSDYDFLLYKYTDSSFCNRLITNKEKPIRSNLAKCDAKLKGRTGLSLNASTIFVGKGMNCSFSKPIAVKTGERYLLVTDNVYSNTSHRLKFNYVKKITINGKVTNFTDEPLTANIILLDKNGKSIDSTRASEETGYYNFNPVIYEDLNYTIMFFNPSYFPETQLINTHNSPTKASLTVDQRFRKLKIGETYNLVYYSAERLVFLKDDELGPIKALAYLMKQNPKLKILIEGHTDKYEVSKSETTCATCKKSDMEIAHERAENVMLLLQKMGTSKNQMEKIALGHDRPQIANPKTEEEKAKNKRVTVKILSL
jgi:flagellar motor protein MotB